MNIALVLLLKFFMLGTHMQSQKETADFFLARFVYDVRSGTNA